MRDRWPTLFRSSSTGDRPPAGAAQFDLLRFTTWTLGLCVLTTYVLFSKKLLPPPVARVVAKVYFWPTMPFTLLSRWNNYWTQMDDMVYLGGAPLGLLGHVGVMESLGIQGVVNLCDEYQGPIEQYHRAGIKQLWLPTVDHTEPSVENMNKAIDFIESFQTQADGTGSDGSGKRPKVLVHCKSGHGRSAAVIMAWLLMADKDVTPRQVQSYLLSKRKVRKTLYRQKDIRKFYKDLLGGDKKTRRGNGNNGGGGGGAGTADGGSSNGAVKDKRTRGLKQR